MPLITHLSCLGKCETRKDPTKQAVDKASLVPNSDKITWPQVSKNLISVLVLDLENAPRVNVSHAHAKKLLIFFI